MSIFYRFRDTAGYLSKVADFDPPHLHLAPPLGVTPVEFREDLWLQKTSVPGLARDVVCMILRLAILVEYRLVTDGHRRTRTQAHGEYRGCIASRGNKKTYLYTQGGSDVISFRVSASWFSPPSCR